MKGPPPDRLSLLRLHPDDEVALALRPLEPGEHLAVGPSQITVREPVPQGHKVALLSVSTAGPIRKYGQVIGFATRDIHPGEHVHVHNLGARDFERVCAAPPALRDTVLRPSGSVPTFPGYLRPDGRVGTRNYVGVFSTVNCSASVARAVRGRFPDAAVRCDYPGVDGVIAFNHQGGCALPPGESLAQLQRVFTGMLQHPNLAACVLIGLGCEVNHLEALRQVGTRQGIAWAGKRVVALGIRECGGLHRAIEAGVSAVSQLLPAAGDARRTPQSINHLVLALQCGGSDGHSGVTANPAVGVASDELVRWGGTSVLAETPEIYGAEHLLAQRAVSADVAIRLLERIRWWEEHLRPYGASMDNNPTPGNKAGGLTTIYEKSLGAAAKGGQSPLVAVYRYAEPITARGFCFMDTPGFDPVSMTGLMSGGCTVGVFTTGRGSVYGGKPMPTVKVATNTPLFECMPDDMDLDAGGILDGRATVADVGRRIFEELVAVAGGKRTKSELAGGGDDEFAPWMIGPTL